MKCKRIFKDELHVWMRDEELFRRDHMNVGSLLSGDRIYCCDEVIAGMTEGKFVGVATIAPRGEKNYGQPTIVALYVHPDHRRQGYGKTIMKAAVRRCVKRGFKKVRVDVMSGWALRAINSLPENLREVLEVNYQGDFMDCHS